jgi:hypothetical protein
LSKEEVITPKSPGGRPVFGGKLLDEDGVEVKQLQSTLTAG